MRDAKHIRVGKLLFVKQRAVPRWFCGNTWSLERAGTWWRCSHETSGKVSPHGWDSPAGAVCDLLRAMIRSHRDDLAVLYQRLREAEGEP